MRRKLGSRVRIARQPGPLGNYFNGRFGTIIGTERDGTNVLYRVRLDLRADVPGVGLVSTDLWSSTNLVSVRTPEQRAKQRAAHWRKTGVSERTISWMKDTGFLLVLVVASILLAGHTPTGCGQDIYHETPITRPCK